MTPAQQNRQFAPATSLRAALHVLPSHERPSLFAGD
jgi:hypothetical protein